MAGGIPLVIPSPWPLGVPAPGYQGGAGGPGGGPPPSVNAGYEVFAYAPPLYNTLMAQIPRYGSLSFSKVLNDKGAGTLVLNLDDVFWNSVTAAAPSPVLPFVCASSTSSVAATSYAAPVSTPSPPGNALLVYAGSDSSTNWPVTCTDTENNPYMLVTNPGTQVSSNPYFQTGFGAGATPSTAGWQAFQGTIQAVTAFQGSPTTFACLVTANDAGTVSGVIGTTATAWLAVVNTSYLVSALVYSPVACSAEIGCDFLNSGVFVSSAESAVTLTAGWNNVGAIVVSPGAGINQGSVHFKITSTQTGQQVMVVGLAASIPHPMQAFLCLNANQLSSATDSITVGFSSSATQKTVLGALSMDNINATQALDLSVGNSGSSTTYTPGTFAPQQSSEMLVYATLAANAMGDATPPAGVTRLLRVGGASGFPYLTFWAAPITNGIAFTPGNFTWGVTGAWNALAISLMGAGTVPSSALLTSGEPLYQVRKDGVPIFEFLAETETYQRADQSEQRNVTVTGPGTIQVLTWADAMPPGFPDPVFKTDAVQDGFAEINTSGALTVDVGLWNTISPASHVSLNPIGTLQLVAQPGTTFCGASPFDLSNSLFSAQVVPLGQSIANAGVSGSGTAPSLDGSQVTQMYFQSNANPNFYALIGVTQTGLYCKLGDNVVQTKQLGTYSQTEQLYWQISHEYSNNNQTSTISFWTSSDGQTWTLVWQVHPSWAPTNGTVFFACAYDVDNSQFMSVTNVNGNVITPSSAGNTYFGEPIMGVWYQLLQAAQQRNTIPFVTTALNFTQDSFGNPWIDSQSVQIQNGTDLYSLLQSHTSMVDADYVMQPGFLLQVGLPHAQSQNAVLASGQQIINFNPYFVQAGAASASGWTTQHSTVAAGASTGINAPYPFSVLVTPTAANGGFANVLSGSGFAFPVTPGATYQVDAWVQGNTVINVNPFLTGGVLTGWDVGGTTPANGTLTLVTQLSGGLPAGGPPLTYGLKFVLAAGGAADITQQPATGHNFTLTANTQYLIGAWVYTSGTSVSIGIDQWNSGVFVSTVSQAVSVTANTWTYITATVTSSASGVNQGGVNLTPQASTTSYFQAMTAQQLPIPVVGIGLDFTGGGGPATVTLQSFAALQAASQGLAAGWQRVTGQFTAPLGYNSATAFCGLSQNARLDIPVLDSLQVAGLTVSPVVPVAQPNPLGLGYDRSLQVVVRESGAIQSDQETHDRSQIANLVGAVNSDGTVVVASNANSIATWGQREGWLQTAVQVDPRSMLIAAQASVLQTENEIPSFTISINPVWPGARPWRDFNVGDWIGLEESIPAGPIQPQSALAAFWGFEDATVDGWTGTNATVAPSSPGLNGTSECVLVTATAGAAGAGFFNAGAPGSLSGLPVNGGEEFYLTIDAKCGPTTPLSQMYAQINWLDSSGTFISTVHGTPVAMSVNQVTTLTLGSLTAPVTAPGNAARMQVFVQENAGDATGTTFFYDNVRVYQLTTVTPQVQAVRVLGIATSIDGTGSETCELTIITYRQWLSEQLQYLVNKLGGQFINSLGTTPVTSNAAGGPTQLPTIFAPDVTGFTNFNLSGVTHGTPLVWNSITGQWQPAGQEDPITGGNVSTTGPNLQTLHYGTPFASPGGMIASISALGGVDDPGNTYLPGIVSYGSDPTQIIQLYQGQITVGTAVGSQVILNPSLDQIFDVTSAIAGVIQAAAELTTNDGSEVFPGILGSLLLGTGSAAKMATALTSPFGNMAGSGACLVLEAENDGLTDNTVMTLGNITSSDGISLTYSPVLTVSPYALLLYGGTTGVTVVTFTSSTTWTCPTGVTATKVECWGDGASGGGGGTTGGGGGGGGGGYAMSPAVAVTPTTGYPINIGTGGAAATGNGNSGTGTNFNTSTVVAAPGTGGIANFGVGGGNTGTQTGTTLFRGSTGGSGAFQHRGGGGGASSAGTGANGNPGSNGGNSAGGNGGGAPAGGARGGTGGAPSASGLAGSAPGGGGGGGGGTTSGTKASGAGGRGQLRLTFLPSGSAPAIQLSVANAAGTDQFGTAFSSGIHYSSPDGNTYRAERKTFIKQSDQQITSAPGTPTLITTLSGIPVAAGSYRITGSISWTQDTAQVTQQLGLQGANITAQTRIWVKAMLPSGDSVVTVAQITSAAPGLAGLFGANFVNGATVYLAEIEGIVAFSASDTFGLEAANGTLNDHWTVKAGSWLDLMPV